MLVHRIELAPQSTSHESPQGAPPRAQKYAVPRTGVAEAVARLNLDGYRVTYDQFHDKPLRGMAVEVVEAHFRTQQFQGKDKPYVSDVEVEILGRIGSGTDRKKLLKKEHRFQRYMGVLEYKGLIYTTTRGTLKKTQLGTEVADRYTTPAPKPKTTKNPEPMAPQENAKSFRGPSGWAKRNHGFLAILQEKGPKTTGELRAIVHGNIKDCLKALDALHRKGLVQSTQKANGEVVWSLPGTEVKTTQPETTQHLSQMAIMTALASGPMTPEDLRMKFRVGSTLFNRVLGGMTGNKYVSNEGGLISLTGRGLDYFSAKTSPTVIPETPKAASVEPPPAVIPPVAPQPQVTQPSFPVEEAGFISKAVGAILGWLF